MQVVRVALLLGTATTTVTNMVQHIPVRLTDIWSTYGEAGQKVQEVCHHILVITTILKNLDSDGAKSAKTTTLAQEVTHTITGDTEPTLPLDGVVSLSQLKDSMDTAMPTSVLTEHPATPTALETALE